MARHQMGREAKPADVARGAGHVVMLDLDNWSRIFALPELERQLPQRTVILGFAAQQWERPRTCDEGMDALKRAGRFALVRCAPRKDAADFAIVSWFTTLDRKLPRHVPITIVSGDGGFSQLDSNTNLIRRPSFVNPHPPHHLGEGDVLRTLIRCGELVPDAQPGGNARPAKKLRAASRLSEAATAADLAAARFVQQMLVPESELAGRLEAGDECLVPRNARRQGDPAFTVARVRAVQTEPNSMCRLCNGHHASPNYGGQTSVSVLVDETHEKKLPLPVIGLLAKQAQGNASAGEPPPWPGDSVPPWRLGAHPTTAEMVRVQFAKPGRRTAMAEPGEYAVCCLQQGLVWGRLVALETMVCDGSWVRKAQEGAEVGNTVSCWEVALGVGADAPRTHLPVHLLGRLRSEAEPPSRAAAVADGSSSKVRQWLDTVP